MNTKLYDILEVSPQASEDDITKSYRKLARQWHPDSPKNRDKQEEATEKFKEIGNAYKILSDQKTRQIYDQFGEDAVQQMANGDGGGMPGFPGGFNPFEDLFSGMGGKSRGPNKSKPILHQLKVSLKELYTGKQYKVKIEIKNACGECDGTGSKSQSNHTCQQCKGKGIQVRIQRMGPIMQQFQEKCSACSGSGKNVPKEDQCQKCSGKEFRHEQKEIDVEVKPGMSWGNRFLMEGMGHTLRDQIPGDLVIEIIPPDEEFGPNGVSNRSETNSNESEFEPNWNRKDNNLEVTVPISLIMALTGVNILLKTFDDRYLRLNLGKEIVQPNTKKIIKGEGMPIFKQDQFDKKVDLKKIQKGDLIVKFQILFPNQLTDEDRKQLSLIFNKSNNKISTNNKNNNKNGKQNKNKQSNTNKNNGIQNPNQSLLNLDEQYSKLFKEHEKKSQKVNLLDYTSDKSYNENDSDDEDVEFDPREQCAQQ